jgi:hypothetical protein
MVKMKKKNKGSDIDRPDALASNEAGLLSMSKRFIVLTFINSQDGKRYPLFVKRVRAFEKKDLTSARAMGIELGRGFIDEDEDGWKWDLHLYSGAERRTFGTGFVRVEDEAGKKLYQISLN